MKFIFKFINPIITTILRSPFHGILSKALMLVEFTGRASGRRMRTPAAYFRESDTVVRAFTESDRQWWRNVIDGQPFHVWIEGKPYGASAEVVTLPPDEMDALLVASYKGMSLDQVHRMFHGAMLLRVTLKKP